MWKKTLTALITIGMLTGMALAQPEYEGYTFDEVVDMYADAEFIQDEENIEHVEGESYAEVIDTEEPVSFRALAMMSGFDNDRYIKGGELTDLDLDLQDADANADIALTIHYLDEVEAEDEEEYFEIAQNLSAEDEYDEEDTYEFSYQEWADEQVDIPLREESTEVYVVTYEIENIRDLDPEAEQPRYFGTGLDNAMYFVDGEEDADSPFAVLPWVFVLLITVVLISRV